MRSSMKRSMNTAWPEEDIVKNGYRIYTELDQNYQASMQVIYDNTALFPVAEDGTRGNLVVSPSILRPEGSGLS